MTRIHYQFSIVVALLLGGCVAPEEMSGPGRLVEFDTSRANRVLTISCKPLNETIAGGTSWVNECNQLGREALDRAASAGLIDPVQGLAFGMASEFAAKLQKMPHVKSISLSRDFPMKPD